MWNDRVSASDTAATVAKRQSVVAGYDAEPDATTTAQGMVESGDAAEYEVNHSGVGANIKLAENSPNTPADFPTTDRDQEVEKVPAKSKRESVVKRESSQPATFPTTVPTIQE